MADAPGQMERPKTEPVESDKAAEAFRDYVRLGADRSHTKLYQQYRSCTEPVPTRQLSRIKIWSATFHWPERIAVARREEATAKLEESADLDADTFLRSSRILNERMHLATTGHVDMVVKVRESVRKPAPKGGASVNVNISVEVRQLAERLAKELGTDAESLIKEAEELAAKEWERV